MPIQGLCHKLSTNTSHDGSNEADYGGIKAVVKAIKNCNIDILIMKFTYEEK